MDAATSAAKTAYAALLKSRTELVTQRDDLTEQIARLDAALDSLSGLIGAQEPADEPPAPDASGAGSARIAVGPAVAVPGARAETADSDPASASQAPRAAGRAGGPTSRKARVREILLESPSEWLTVQDIAVRIGGGEPSAAQRTATYEMLRRMAVQGELERDSKAKPTRFRAKATVLRERLLQTSK